MHDVAKFVKECVDLGKTEQGRFCFRWFRHVPQYRAGRGDRRALLKIAAARDYGYNALMPKFSVSGEQVKEKMPTYLG